MVWLTRYPGAPSSRGLAGLQRLNRMLDEALALGLAGVEQGQAITSAWFAPTDIYEDEQGLEIAMELPGVRPGDVRISLEGNVLTVRGEKRQESERENERVHRYERSYGAFERSFELPSTADPDHITAAHEQGVLRITVPRAERARAREIRISSGAEPISGPSVIQRGPGNPQDTGDRDPEEEGSAGKTQI